MKLDISVAPEIALLAAGGDAAADRGAAGPSGPPGPPGRRPGRAADHWLPGPLPAAAGRRSARLAGPGPVRPAPAGARPVADARAGLRGVAAGAAPAAPRGQAAAAVALGRGVPGGRGDGRAGRPARGAADPSPALRPDPGARQPGTPSHGQYRQRVCGQLARPVGDPERNASITWRGPLPRCGGRI